MAEPLWQPSQEQIDRANLTAFMRAVEQEQGLKFGSFTDLYEWSVQHPERFWPAMWRFGGIVAGKKWDTVVEDRDMMPGARWFVGSRLNFAENLLRYRDDQPALVFCGEDGSRRSVTFAEMYEQVGRIAAAMRGMGVKTGDRVGAFMPNLPETVLAMLAAASIGAIWSSCSPDFGINGVMDRFGQIEPKVLFAADGYFYNGKAHSSMERVKGIAERIPTIEKVVVVPYADPEPDLGGIRNAVLLADFMAPADGKPIAFEQLPFDHPLYIMYSSGTTGMPKCIVHGAGGTLIQHLKELMLHTDLKRQDRIFYFTTCGWMMWNWLVSSLAAGATVLLYDGSPFYPDGNRLFDFARDEGMTIFGTSAKYIASVEKAGLEPGKTHDLSALRAMCSTGSPLAPESFEFVYDKIKRDLLLASISGGTDIISCFALGCPVRPVWRGELQTRGLGMKVDVFDDDGHSIRGEKGELVCTAPFPSMPIYFWNDPDGQKYHEAYFDVYPDVWRHGDYVELTEHDGMTIYGRSDAVLNPGGVRIGTAEIYRQVEAMPDVAEALVVGQDWDNDVRVVLFVRLAEGVTLDEEMIGRMKKSIRANCTPRHVPDRIIQVADIPRTISGKIVELAVRNVIHNRPVKNADALANPEALEHFKNLPELQT
ncbi:MAG TPA: acetoacetate--CoA ligase [Phycisphaerae bacterium]|nr:acetoacetate--CoA ligase [Phycisphaerae bacterium]